MYHMGRKDLIGNSEQMNQQTRGFLDNFTSALIQNYQKRWQTSHKLIELYEGRDLSQFPNADQLRENLNRAKVDVQKMEEQAEIVKKFGPVVEEMIKNRQELNLPYFLITELLTISPKEVTDVVSNIFDKDGQKIDGLGENTEKTGYIARVFTGKQVALKAKFGTDGKSTIVSTEITLTLYSLLNKES